MYTPRETATPAAACCSIAETVPRRLPSGWPSASHACLAPVTPSAHRRIVPCSRSAWCSACEPGRSQPCYSSQSPFVGRSVGGPRHAPTAGKRPIPTRSGTRVAVFPSVRGGAPRDARERPPTAPSAKPTQDAAWDRDMRGSLHMGRLFRRPKGLNRHWGI